MRIALRFCILITILVAAWAGYCILDTEVSIKYEIEEPRLGKSGNIDQTIVEKAWYYHRILKAYWAVVGICIVTFIVLLVKVNRNATPK